MVRSAEKTSRDGSKKYCRLSERVPKSSLDLYDNESRSFSDSEVEKSSSLTAEFLNLPRRLSERSMSPLLYCLDPEKLYLNLKSEYSKTQCNTGARERSNTEPPRVQLSNIEVIVDNIDEESQTIDDDMYVDNYKQCDNEEFTRRGSGVWINLGPQNHTLLSPRSSNGSICSYRSSNADSAIEMLTPDDELPDQPLAEASAMDYNKLWETRHRSRSDDHHTIPGSSIEGAISDFEVFSTVSSISTPKTSASQCSVTPQSHLSLNSMLTQSMQNLDLTNSDASDHSNFSVFETPLLKTPQGRQSAITAPSVVVSDFSSKGVQDKGSQTLQVDLEDVYNDELLGDRVLYNRSYSNSSISSESSLSMFSDTSSDVANLDDFPTKKVS